MKTSMFVAVICAIATPLTTLAQTKGDTVVVIKEAEFKDGDTVFRSIRPGVTLQVLDVKADQLKVSMGQTGWIQKKNVTTVAKALEIFNAQIKQNPKDANGYIARGIALHFKGDLNAAITDFTAALRLDPKQAEVFLRRGTCWDAKKESDQAIADYSDAIRLAPDSHQYLFVRAAAWEKSKKYDKAIADYTEVVRLKPDFDASLNQLAWIMATCPDAKVRDGKKAVEYGTKLCELSKWHEFSDLDTISAAYAEAGDFENAVKWQTKVVSMAPDKEKAMYQSRLDLYRSGKPFREKE